MNDQISFFEPIFSSEPSLPRQATASIGKKAINTAKRSNNLKNN